MQDALFLLFALVTLVGAVLVVANPFSRDPVASAMFLVVTFIGLSGLFVLLGAFFLAAIQILVYAGAVMVLFLFVLMLLNLREEQRRKYSLVKGFLGTLLVGLLASFLIGTIFGAPALIVPGPATMNAGAGPLGKMLFLHYLLPFEVVSILLLVAIIGVVILSKKDTR
jgi:NADH-quinone oxidoreductase subunit J